MKARDLAKQMGNHILYKKLRNKVNYMIKTSKSSFYYNAIRNSKGNSKQLWKCMKSVIGNTCNQNKAATSIKVGENIFSDTEDICNELNKFFTNIAESSVKHLPHQEYTPSPKFIEFIESKLPNEVKFDIPNITEGYVAKALQQLDSSKATGLDGIGAKYLSIGANVINKPLTNIINKSIHLWIFPDPWKLAKVYALYKKGCPLESSNYRPISILPILSKLWKNMSTTHYTSILLPMVCFVQVSLASGNFIHVNQV